MTEKQTYKISKGFRTVFTKVKPNFRKNRSDVFNVPTVNNAISQANPLESQSIGVHRSQVQEFNEMYRDAGIVGAMHKENGNLVMESRQARNEVLKLRGCRDNDAGYGDYCGEHN
jgi:hypothetical protein